MCGLNPQVITEALYALHQEDLKVDAIRIITTSEGKERINAHLLSPLDGQYYSYMRDYRVDSGQIDFEPKHVEIITGEDGREVSDIISDDDNECLLRKCLELTFELTSDQDAAVFFLVAGGRKTMSSCLTLAAQLYARPQDRIYHVLVSPEFEGNRNFYYPPPVPVKIELRDSKGEIYYKSTDYAGINLVSIPCISIRSQLPVEWLKTPHDPATLMISLTRRTRYYLTLNLVEKKVVYKGKELDLQPSLMAVYSFFAMKKVNCHDDVSSCRQCRKCFRSTQEIFAEQGELTGLYRRIVGNDSFLLDRADGRINQLDHESFHQYKAKIKEGIKKAFGQNFLSKLEISSQGRRPDKRFGLIMEKEHIKIIG